MPVRWNDTCPPAGAPGGCRARGRRSSWLAMWETLKNSAQCPDCLLTCFHYYMMIRTGKAAGIRRPLEKEPTHAICEDPLTLPTAKLHHRPQLFVSESCRLCLCALRKSDPGSRPGGLWGCLPPPVTWGTAAAGVPYFYPLPTAPALPRPFPFGSQPGLRVLQKFPRPLAVSPGENERLLQAGSKPHSWSRGGTAGGRRGTARAFFILL